MQFDASWSPGEHVLVQRVWAQRVLCAFPATVIADSTERVAVYIAHGTEVAGIQAASDRGPRVLVDGRWMLTRYPFVGNHVGMWAPGEACSVWSVWTADWQHLGWKVNPERSVRSGLGIQTTDHVLDAVIGPDCSSWRFDDEEEFADALAVGMLSPGEAAQVRAVTAGVAKGLIDGDRRRELLAWTEWRPPSAWRPPPLPEGWETV